MKPTPTRKKPRTKDGRYRWPLPQFARSLRLWRSTRKLTRASAGLLLGVSGRTVEAWERGRSPHPVIASFLEKKIGVDRTTPAA